MNNIRGTVFLWHAAGRPMPTNTDGSPIIAKPRLGATCASCGSTDAHYSMSDAISDNFTTVRNASRAWAYGGDALCAACVWACKSVALRCAMFFARETGFYFVPTWALKGFPSSKPNPLTALLNPPEPPFVACYPRTGVDHGGEDALERTMFQAPELTSEILEIRTTMESALAALLKAKPKDMDGPSAKKFGMQCLVNMTEPWPSKVDFDDLRRRYWQHRWKTWWRWAAWPLIRIQSKHCALYARVSTTRDRYHLQVDDASDIMVDVPIWRDALSVVEPLLRDLREAGVGSRDATSALLSLRPPVGAPMAVIAGWQKRTAPLRSHVGSAWWPVFVSLVRMPAFEKEGT